MNMRCKKAAQRSESRSPLNRRMSSKTQVFHLLKQDWELEQRQLLATVMGQIIDDFNGNGLRDVGEVGVENIPVVISKLNLETGAISDSFTVMTNSEGYYQADGLQRGTYLISESLPENRLLTWPTVEHTGRDYVVNIEEENQVIGEFLSDPLTDPEANWVENLPAGTYTIPVTADFMFQFGSEGIGPSRVAFSGIITFETLPADSNGVVQTSIKDVNLHGSISSDQHEQGYLGGITLKLGGNSTGTLTTRSDNPTLADSDFDLFAEIEIPDAFGVSTKLYNTSAIPLLAREIMRFPAIGSAYNYRGTTTPVAFVNEDGVEQGRLFFATMTPQVGVDFGTFQYANVNGRCFIDHEGNGVFDSTDTPLVGIPVTLTKIVEESGSTGEEGSGKGTGSPPDGKGEFPNAPITVFTDADGFYKFQNLSPGNYVVSQSALPPITITLPETSDSSYQLSPVTSGADLTLNFGNTFAEGSENHSSAPAPYPEAVHTIVSNLRMGATILAYNPDNPYPDPYPNDGLTFQSAMVSGTETPVSLNLVASNTGGQALLQGWVDFNGDGDFADDGEQVFTDTEVNHGLNELVISVPAGLTLPTDRKLETYARFRVSTVDGLNDSEPAPDGEVEDYPVTIYDVNLLGSIRGQTWDDSDGDGLRDPEEKAMNGWRVTLKNLDTGMIVGSLITETKDIPYGGSNTLIDGLYGFDNLLPGYYELMALPPAEFGDFAMTLPMSEESAVSYRFQLREGEQRGQWQFPTTTASEGWLEGLSPGIDSTFTLGQFFLLKNAGGGSGGGSGSDSQSSSGGSPTIRINVTGNQSIIRDAYSEGGFITSELSQLSLNGLAVEVNEETGEQKVLGEVAVKLGILPSSGTIGTGTGETETSGDTASFAIYLEIDASALGLGTIINTHPIVASGSVSQIPMIGTALAREGKGSPIAMIDKVTGEQVARMISAKLLPLYGLDYGAFALADLSGSVLEDSDNNGIHDEGEGNLSGVTVRVEQFVVEEEGGSGHSGGGGSSGHGGSGGETEVPPVYLTRTDANGNWSITGLGPGPWKVTILAPPSYAISGNGSMEQIVTLSSGSDASGLNFMAYPLNDPPTLAGPVSGMTQEDTELIFSTANGNAIVVGDPDSGNDPVQLTINVTLGSISLAATDGLSFISGLHENATDLVVTGTLADINAALDGLRFNPSANLFGLGGISLIVNDQGHNGAGGPLSVSQTIPIEISAVADAPSVTTQNAHGEEGKPVALSVHVSSNDPTGTEVLSVIISGVPANASLNAGTKLPDGRYQLSPDQLPGLVLLPQDNGKFNLTVIATSTAPSSGSMASLSDEFQLDIVNLAPGITTSGGKACIPGVVTNFPLGTMSDVPGDGPWSVDVQWGDGASTSFKVTDPTGFELSGLHGYGRTGLKTVSFTVTDKDGGSATSSFSVVAGPPAIEEIVVNDGSSQRSMVNSLNLYFNGIVSIDPNAIVLTRQNGRPITNTSLTIDSYVDESLRTVATIGFAGRGAIGGSLADGRYRLSVNMGMIHDVATGLIGTTDFNGPSGGTKSYDFFRLFGDSNGNAMIDGEDRMLFRSTYRSREGNENYVAFMDYNTNGLISGGDLDQFRRRRRV